MGRPAFAVTLALLSACSPAGEQGTQGGAPPPDSAAQGPLPTPAALVSVLVRLEPVLRAREAVVRQLRADSGTPDADSVFLEARGSFAVAIDSVGSAMYGDGAFQAWVTGDSAAVGEAEAWFRSRGLRLTWSEGSAYPSEDTGAWLRLAGPFVTTAMREYLARRDHDEAQGFTNDAALQIPWDSLAERIVAWDAFIEGHAGFVLVRDAEMWRGIYLRTYLTGLDNSRVFEDGLVPEVRRSYERFVERHGTTRTGRLLAEYLEVLRGSGGRETAEVHAFWRANDVRSMIGMQPPIR